MKLWKIERTDHVDYDEYDAAIIRADNAARAVELLFDDLGSGWGSGFRQDPPNYTVALLTETGNAGVVLASFNAG